MSIRIRTIDGLPVALCAARTQAEPGDLYLDDAAHEALADKFSRDWYGNGLMPADVCSDKRRVLMDALEEGAEG